MIKAKTIMTLDTETTDLRGMIYDLGFVIHNKKGKIVHSFNALIDEVFTDPSKMVNAFFAKKVFTHYAPMLDRQSIRLISWLDTVEIFRQAQLDYDVDIVAAYNLGFDLRALKHTNQHLGDGRPMCAGVVDLLDIWQFSCETILNTATYKHIATELGWVSEAGNIQTTAENAYKFCAGDFGFIEDHTALSDATIEAAILAECFKQKKKIPYGVMNAQPWRIVNAK